MGYEKNICNTEKQKEFQHFCVIFVRKLNLAKLWHSGTRRRFASNFTTFRSQHSRQFVLLWDNAWNWKKESFGSRMFYNLWNISEIFYTALWLSGLYVTKHGINSILFEFYRKQKYFVQVFATFIWRIASETLIYLYP